MCIRLRGFWRIEELGRFFLYIRLFGFSWICFDFSLVFLRLRDFGFLEVGFVRVLFREVGFWIGFLVFFCVCIE